MAEKRKARSKSVTFPELIADELERIGGSRPQDVLADRLGTTQSNISRWRANQQLPRQATWPQIAEGLKMSADELSAAIGRSRPERPPSLAQQLHEAHERIKALEAELDRVMKGHDQAS